MKISIVSIVAAVLLVLVGLFLWGYADTGGTAGANYGAPPSGAASALIAAEKSFDFGTISMKNGNVTKDFSIQNPTPSDVTVSTIVTSCMCTAAYIVKSDGSLKGPFGMSGHGYVPPANEVIEAGGSRTMRIVYDPNAHGPAGVGKIDRYVLLTDSTGGALEFEIQAQVTP